jgi:arylsulfatase B
MKGRTDRHVPHAHWRGVFFAAAVLCAFDTAATAQSPPPNFVVIVLDDVGTDKLNFYGQPVAWDENHASTPILDTIAANGAVFWNAYASPQCSPSRAMLLTGRHAFKTGMFGLSDGDDYDLPDSEILLPEMLKDIDDSYVAGAFGKWHVTDSLNTNLLRDCYHPIRNEFDVFVGHLANVEDGHFNWKRIDTRVSCDFEMNTNWIGSQVRLDAVDWIEDQEAPFFAYVAFHPPHAPFQVPPLDHVTPGLVPVDLDVGDNVNGTGCGAPCTSCSVETDNWLKRTVYRANIEAIDYEIGALLSSLPANTYVIIMGDNGSEVSAVQSDDTNYAEAGAPYPPKHAKRSITQMGARVPLLVIGPDVVAGVRYAPVSAVDIWRTMADLAGDPSAVGGTHSLSFRQLIVAAESWPPPAGARRRAYIESSVFNKNTWNGTQWTPAVPPGLQRALVSYDGLKYMRYGSGHGTPTCITLQDCAFAPPGDGFVAEEAHQLYTYVSTFQPCDENEIGMSSSCSPLPNCQSPAVATLRTLMLNLTGP